jgi:hypothetical protein
MSKIYRPSSCSSFALTLSIIEANIIHENDVYDYGSAEAASASCGPQQAVLGERSTRVYGLELGPPWPRISEYGAKLDGILSVAV